MKSLSKIMDIGNIFEIKKTDSLEIWNNVESLDNNIYIVKELDKTVRFEYINCYKKIEVFLKELIPFTFFNSIIKEDFIALYNFYDEQTYFNFNTNNKKINLICDRYFVNNYQNAKIKEFYIFFE
nr:hypothetical protein [uncultured Capnocytophaga sp.]